MADQSVRDLKLVQYLNEAYGKERELETALQAHIGMTTKAPYKKRLQQHLKETKAHARAEDLDVNAVREKKLTNVRAAGSDETVKLVPAHRLSLDQALEFIRDDECVEVTPDAVRLRKLTLDPVARQKESRARRRVEPAATP